MMALGSYRSMHRLVLAWSFSVQDALAKYKLMHPYAMWAYFWCVLVFLVLQVVVESMHATTV